MSSIFRVFVCICLLTLTAAGQSAQSRQVKPLRIFISVDLEGIAGVVDPAQLGPGGFEYEHARHLMTGEANAAIDGALRAGATEITVADGHGNGLSILPEELNPKARLIRSWPRPLGMMDGIDRGFDAVLLIGYHASSNTPDAVLSHTLSGSGFFEVRLNGKHASEALISAASAGEFGVPVVLVSGDNQLVDEVHKSIDPNITGVAVKRAIGFHSADSLSPKLAQSMIADATQEALSKLASARPFVLSKPVQVEITFKNTLNAETFSYLPNIEREDGATVRFTGKDMVEARKFLSFVGETAR
jgi:D-amino peptidase